MDTVFVFVLQRCSNLFRPLQHAPYKSYRTVGDEVAQPASFSAQLGFGPLCAFRLVSYSPSLCVVQLLATLGEGTAQVVHVEFLVDLLAAPFQTGVARRIAHGSLTNTRLGRCAQDDTSATTLLFHAKAFPVAGLAACLRPLP